MFSYEFVNRIFNGVLVNRSEIFVDLLIKRGVRKLPLSLFLVEVGPPNNLGAALVGRFNNNVFAFLRLLGADHSSEERLENLVVRLKLSLLISWRHFLMKKCNDANWPSGGVHFDF